MLGILSLGVLGADLAGTASIGDVVLPNVVARIVRFQQDGTKVTANILEGTTEFVISEPDPHAGTYAIDPVAIQGQPPLDLTGLAIEGLSDPAVLSETLSAHAPVFLADVSTADSMAFVSWSIRRNGAEVATTATHTVLQADLDEGLTVQNRIEYDDPAVEVLTSALAVVATGTPGEIVAYLDTQGRAAFNCVPDGVSDLILSGATSFPGTYQINPDNIDGAAPTVLSDVIVTGGSTSPPTVGDILSIEGAAYIKNQDDGPLVHKAWEWETAGNVIATTQAITFNAEMDVLGVKARRLVQNALGISTSELVVKPPLPYTPTAVASDGAARLQTPVLSGGAITELLFIAEFDILPLNGTTRQLAVGTGLNVNITQSSSDQISVRIGDNGTNTFIFDPVAEGFAAGDTLTILCSLKTGADEFSYISVAKHNASAAPTVLTFAAGNVGPALSEAAIDLFGQPGLAWDAGAKVYRFAAWPGISPDVRDPDIMTRFIDMQTSEPRANGVADFFYGAPVWIFDGDVTNWTTTGTLSTGGLTNAV